MALSATAISTALAAWLSTVSPPAIDVARLDVARLLELAGGFRAAAVEWGAVGWSRHPVLMVGLAAAFALPILAIPGLVLHRLASRGAAPPVRPRPAVEPRRVWLEGAAGERVPVPSCRDLVQIGRLADNDICIDDASVHRYHAVIERMPGCGFVIVDVSGNSGNGVRVNGERVARRLLAPGDLLELGRARLRFEAAA